MKEVLLIMFLAFFLIITPGLATKNITFITSCQQCHLTTCNNTNLDSSERAFCYRLNTTLQYPVYLIWENEVKSNSSDWRNYANISSMIFFGNVSTSSVDITQDRNIFCGNVSAMMTPQRRVFATFKSAYKDMSKSLLGCAFSNPINLVSYGLDNNTCSYSVFQKIKDGYITEGFPNQIGMSSQSRIMVHGNADEGLGWVGAAACQPPGNAAGTYSVVNTSSKGAFWGLDKATLLTDDGWTIFDRTVLEVMNDTTWDVTPYVIPENATTNDTVWLIANILERGKPVSDGPVNFSVSGSVWGNLSFLNNYWWNTTSMFPNPNSYSIRINARRGNATLNLPVGNMTVNISSNNYFPNTYYTIKATTWSGSNPINPAFGTAYYKIWNMSEPTILKSGTLDCTLNSCERVINTSDWDSFVLEVTAYNSSTYFGGSLRIINVTAEIGGNLTTNKSTYKPTEMMVTSLKTGQDLTSADMMIVRPDGTNETPSPIPMYNQSNYSYWLDNYTFGAAAPNGTYTIYVRGFVGSQFASFNDTVDVVPYNVLASLLNKTNYNVGDNLTAKVQITDAYSGNVNISVVMSIIDPQSNVTQIGSALISGSNQYNATFKIPSNFSAGNYNLNIYLNDSDNRAFSTNLSFTVNNTGAITITPSFWNITAATDSKTFVINNTGPTTLSNMTLTVSGNISQYITLNTSSISSLSPSQAAAFYANVSLPQHGFWKGSIAASSGTSSFVIDITANFMTGTIPNNLVVTPTFLYVVIIPDRTTNQQVTLENTGLTAATGFQTNATGLIAPMVSATQTPSSIAANGQDTLGLKIDTTGEDEGTYDGDVNITSSAGYAILSVTIDVIGDLSAQATSKLTLLNNLLANITSLESQGKNTTSVRSLYNQTKTLLQDVQTDYNNGDWADAKSKFDTAEQQISSITSMITALATERGPDYSWVIWTIAFVVIIIIVGITAFKYRNKIKELIDRILKKEKPQQEQQQQEYYPQESGGGEYRTEYY